MGFLSPGGLLHHIGRAYQRLIYLGIGLNMFLPWALYHPVRVYYWSIQATELFGIDESCSAGLKFDLECPYVTKRMLCM